MWRETILVLGMNVLVSSNSYNQIRGLYIGNPVQIDKFCGYANDILFIIKD